jgi:hypothetical protein
LRAAGQPSARDAFGSPNLSHSSQVFSKCINASWVGRLKIQFQDPPQCRFIGCQRTRQRSEAQ